MDLAAAAAAISKASMGRAMAFAQWTGGKIAIDEAAFIGRLASVVSTAMGANLFKGLKPDGSGPMPGRKKDGKPRGQGSKIARALRALPIGPGEWLITAHKEIAGHLARIFQGEEFRAPPLSTLTAAINAAFRKSTFTGALTEALKGPFESILRRGSRPHLGGMLRGRGLEKSTAWQGMGGIRLTRALRGKGTGFGRALRGPRKR